ncbi:hypothetical protein BDK51DRAFT_35360 [Blyttiomyces helicus]|uniref:Uncharacterized protein n=1 Tax=Blyttiomyces helicus TaxID=388810 RepID=A0A4P9WQ85_9FUNG|nr:hypothetical protein BDK51DRAFT_35360 [Blyttiomyces helicus]|eukprot:RKO93370.1 hypothetical protein BDK51DRAFT_35360 [Blyttiomyces helicus]
MDALKHLGKHLKAGATMERRTATNPLPAASSMPATDSSIGKENDINLTESKKLDTLAQTTSLQAKQIWTLHRKIAVVEALDERLLQANKMPSLRPPTKPQKSQLSLSMAWKDYARLRAGWMPTSKAQKPSFPTYPKYQTQTTEFQKKTRHKVDRIVTFIQKNGHNVPNLTFPAKRLFSVPTYMHGHNAGGTLTKLAPDLNKSLQMVTTLDHTPIDRRTFAQAQTVEGQNQLNNFHPTIDMIRFLKVTRSEECLDCFYKTVTGQLEKRTYRPCPPILLWARE